MTAPMRSPSALSAESLSFNPPKVGWIASTFNGFGRGVPLIPCMRGVFAAPIFNVRWRLAGPRTISSTDAHGHNSHPFRNCHAGAIGNAFVSCSAGFWSLGWPVSSCRLVDTLSGGACGCRPDWSCTFLHNRSINTYFAGDARRFFGNARPGRLVDRCAALRPKTHRTPASLSATHQSKVGEDHPTISGFPGAAICGCGPNQLVRKLRIAVVC